MNYDRLEVFKSRSSVEANDFYESKSHSDDLFELDYPTATESNYVVWKLVPIKSTVFY